MTRARLRVGIGAAVVAITVACGHKGPPQAPLRPVPVAVPEWAIEREGAAVRIRITVPDANTDGSMPPAVDRVEVFAVSLPADASPPPAGDVTLAANLVATVAVRSGEAAEPGAPPDPRPAAGEVAVIVDAVPGAGTGEAAPMVRYYAVVPAAGRRRGQASPVLRVPVSVSPAAPAGVLADYTEQTLVLTWQASGAGQRFIVEDTDERGAGAKKATAAPLDAPPFEVPVQFGPRRCFTVRAVEVAGAVSVIGAPSAPACVTPRDRFPPPVPTGLLAVAVPGAIELAWTAVPAADLAGYLVLRGDGPNGTLQRLTPEPVAASSYRDQAVRAGETYVYAVIAVDSAAPPNESAPSVRQVVAARAAGPRGRPGRWIVR